MTTYYSEEHEWITVEGDTATIGITAHAAEQLGPIPTANSLSFTAACLVA